MTTDPTIQLPPPIWGERTSLLDKQLLYMFSLDLSYVLDKEGLGSVTTGLRVAVQSPLKGERGFTFHVQDELLTRIDDGVVCNVPIGSVTRASDTMVIGDNGIATLDGRILLNVEGPISVAYTGVASFRGGAAIALKHALDRDDPRSVTSGSAFISLRTECERPKYRWMVEHQLFGYGRVELHPAETGCTVEFSYDVYEGG